MAGLNGIPAVIKDFDEAQMMEIALIENLQREDLNPVEEALAYRTLLEEFGLTQEQLAQRLGRSRPQISNTLRLLSLSAEIQGELAAGRLSMGHAKVLLGLEDGQAQERIARRITADSLSVREVEAIVKNVGSPKGRPAQKRKSSGGDPELGDIEERLRQALGTPVKIVPGRPKGRIEVNYYGTEDLERIVGAILGSDQRTESGARPGGRLLRI
jgi:ParB family chromosome partitioning protein